MCVCVCPCCKFSLVFSQMSTQCFCWLFKLRRRQKLYKKPTRFHTESDQKLGKTPRKFAEILTRFATESDQKLSKTLMEFVQLPTRFLMESDRHPARFRTKHRLSPPFLPFSPSPLSPLPPLPPYLGSSVIIIIAARYIESVRNQ